jgi:hypothetical protein
VRDGADAELPRDRETGKSTHTLLPVYGEMLMQICRDYPSLPDPRTMTLAEIRFFYNGGRASLREFTKPRK